MKNIILWWGLNSGKWAILRHMAYGNPNIGELSQEMLKNKFSHSVELTDVVRNTYVMNMDSQSWREKLFPKFWQTKRVPKPTTQEIFDNLGWIDEWIKAEIKETKQLFNGEIRRILENKTRPVIVAGVWVDPEWLYRYLQDYSWENIDISFFIKTNRNLIRQRLEIDKEIEVFKYAWPLRLANINDWVEIIAQFSEYIGENAMKRWFRVVEIWADTDTTFIHEWERIIDLIKKNPL
jgi:hypothetical protein